MKKTGGVWDGGELSCYGRFKVINFRHKIVRECATQATVLLVSSSPICGPSPIYPISVLPISPGLQLPSQPLRGLLPISLLGEQMQDGCEQFA